MQTTYAKRQAVAFAGLISDIRINVIEGRLVQEPNGIDFGYGVVAGDSPEVNIRLPYKDNASLVFAGDFVTANVINLSVNGVAIAPVTFDTDHDTTVVALVSAINALSGVSAVLDATDTDNRTIIITAGNTDIAVTGIAVTLGATQTTGTATVANTTGAFRGFTVHSHDNEQSLSGGANYIDNKMASCMEFGSLWVKYDESITPAVDDKVYLVSSGVKRGQITNVSSGNIDSVSWVVKSVRTDLKLVEIKNTK